MTPSDTLTWTRTYTLVNCPDSWLLECHPPPVAGCGWSGGDCGRAGAPAAPLGCCCLSQVLEQHSRQGHRLGQTAWVHILAPPLTTMSDLGQVPSPLPDSVSPTIKWGLARIWSIDSIRRSYNARHMVSRSSCYYFHRHLLPSDADGPLPSTETLLGLLFPHPWTPPLDHVTSGP